MKGLSAVALASLVAVGCDAPPTDSSGHALITATVDVGPGIAIDDPIVSTTGISASEPAIAFDGVNYLVVWSDARDHRTPDIWAARVAGDGTVIDTLAFPIAA